MNKSFLASIGAISAIALTGSLCAAQQLPPIRPLGPIVHTAAEKLGAVSTVRQLPGGRVLVNDIVGHRVLMFDSTLATATVVADSTSATGNAYGVRPGGLIAYHGDSTLFVDPASLSMLLIDPNGKIARVMSAPRANDAAFLVGGPFGTPGFDARGRLVYRGQNRPIFPAGGRPRDGNFVMPPQPDSAAVVRFDLATRKLDTAAFFRIPKISLTMSQTPNGGITVTTTFNPLPLADDWAILSDGTIAVVRGKDFHIDWISPEGTLTSTPKIPFEWQRLTDEDKVAFMDSVKPAIEKARASAELALGGERRTMTVTAGGNGTVTTVGPGIPGTGARSGGENDARPGSAREGGRGGRAQPQLNFVSPSELPDYKPPFGPGATRADAEGNLWIRTSQNVNGLPVYAIVNRKGELIDRVQLPAGRVIAGFGAGGIVYLGVRDADSARLEMARVR